MEKEAEDIKEEKKFEKNRCKVCGKEADEDGLCPKCGSCSECCQCGEVM